MNLVIGAEAAKLPEKEYINGIFFAVQELAHRAEKNTVFFFVFQYATQTVGIHLMRESGL
jgi:hypothetical protein